MKDKKTVFQSKKKKILRRIMAITIFLLVIIAIYLVLPGSNISRGIKMIGLGFFVVYIIASIRKETKVVENSPEQTQQVKVIGKRTSEQFKFKSDDSVFDYIIAFGFQDGSIKELRVGNSVKSDSVIYDSIHEGDTGELIFKEREDIEAHYYRNDKQDHWNGRLFINFKNDRGRGYL